MTHPPPLPLESKLIYVALRTSEESRELTGLLRSLYYQNIRMAEAYGRGSDILIIDYVKQNEPAVVFFSGDRPQIAGAIEENKARSLLVMTVQVNNGISQPLFYRNTGKTPENRADYIVENGVEGAKRFVREGLRRCYEEQQQTLEQVLSDSRFVAFDR